MFLQVVPLVGDVCYHFVSVRQTDLCDFAHGRIWLLRRAGHDLQTDTSAERSFLQSGRLALILQLVSSFSDELVNCRHYTCKNWVYYVSRTPGETERE